MNDIAYLYDGTLEGLLSAVFEAYQRHENPTDVMTSENLQLRLGQQALTIQSNQEKAERVHRKIVSIDGGTIFDAVKHAAQSDDIHTGTIIYHYLRLAFQGSLSPRALTEDFTHVEVLNLHKLSRSVYHERHYIMQFLRFEHLENGIWFATCNPKASVVPLIMDWFAGRFNTQPFIIYDEVHNIAGVHEQKDWYLVKSDVLDIPDRAADEKHMQTAWKRFYDTIAVESRYNPELRRQFMPKRFWKNITEMQETTCAPLARA